jgi:hypothetical protein
VCTWVVIKSAAGKTVGSNKHVLVCMCVCLCACTWVVIKIAAGKTMGTTKQRALALSAVSKCKTPDTLSP